VTTPDLPTGLYYFDAPCPKCGQVERIPGDVRTVLTVPDDDVANVRIKLKAKPVAHVCHQTRISLATTRLSPGGTKPLDLDDGPDS
jgi:hypothetical protein